MACVTLRRAQEDIWESGDTRDIDEQMCNVENAVDAETRRGKFTGKHAARGESSSGALPSGKKKKQKKKQKTKKGKAAKGSGGATCEPEPTVESVAGPGANPFPTKHA